MWLMTIYRLMWEMWAQPQCTRCGGQHTLSRCPWPVVEPGKSE
jgi:hypothetical protein